MDIKPYVEALNSKNLKAEGIIVMQHGKRIAEYRWIPEAPRNAFSVSKSFTSMAVGVAIGEGKLSLKDKVIDVLEKGIHRIDARFSLLTLEHCLTMNMGHNEFTRPQSVDEALSYELARDPGSGFFYDNTCTFLASAMVSKAIGLKVRDLLVERLFRPLGIPDPAWTESEDGYTIGATGLELSTSSLALFGQFLLRRGNWNGKQLVPAAWIDGATRTQVSTRNNNDDDYNLGYGYQFWTCRHGAFRCDGKDGQFVIVLPLLDAVIAISSNEDNMKPILWAVWDHILPQF
ncbi:penicillin-binding protein [Spirochaetia bacterium]|nr:penicillin-binding protein [Spirochaetia bacterium]